MSETNLESLSDHELLELKQQLTNQVSKYKNFQNGLKLFLNSLYGVFGLCYFMYYDRRLAEAITCTGQGVIKWIESSLNTYFNKLLKTTDQDYVTLIDTDSITLHVKPLLDKVYEGRTFTNEEACDFLNTIFNQKILPYVNRQYDEFQAILNCPENTLNFKIDTITSRAIYLSKKHYIYNVLEAEGVRYAKPEKKMMGIESVKSSTPKVVRDKLSECIEIILTKGRDEVKEFVDKFRKEWDTIPIEKIALPCGTSDLMKYKSNVTIYSKGAQAHIRAALIYNHLITVNKLTHKYPLIKNGDKIRYVYLKPKNLIRDNVIAFIDHIPVEFETKYNISAYVDRKKQFEKSFLKPIESILEKINMEMKADNSLF